MTLWSTTQWVHVHRWRLYTMGMALSGRLVYVCTVCGEAVPA